MTDKSSERQQSEELADLLDQLISGGSGHVNITFAGEENSINIQTVKSTDCGSKGACCQPTENAVDEED